MVESEKTGIFYIDPSMVEMVPIGDLKLYKKNAKKHPQEQIQQIINSINAFGMNDPIGIWGEDNVIVEGHGRYLALREMGESGEIPVIRLDHLSDEQRRAYALAHNQLTMNTDFNMELLMPELDSLSDAFEMADFGFEDYTQSDNEQDNQYADGVVGSIEEKYIIPPVSVLDSRQGRWTKRQRLWNSEIQDTGVTRGTAKTYNLEKFQTDDKFKSLKEISVLDPVLAECIVRWFTPYEQSKCFDTFAGDTIFGYVSGKLGHSFTGIELRQEQADFNNSRTESFDCKYYCDDGRNVLNYIAPNSQDLFFSCPPYFDLEVYSDLENDASNQKSYEQFYEILDKAFTDAVRCLKNDRFAVIVVTEVRNKKTGFYYDFTGDIKRTFQKAGMNFYNDLVLVNQVGSVCMRINQYMKTRKIGRCHQNVLVFYKGNPANIKDNFQPIEIDESLFGDDIDGSQNI